MCSNLSGHHHWVTHTLHVPQTWWPPLSDSYNTCVLKPEWSPSLSDSHTTCTPNLSDHHHWLTFTLHILKTRVITITESLTHYMSPKPECHQTRVITITEWLTHYMYPKPEWSPPVSDSLTQHVSPNLSEHHHWVTLTLHILQTRVITITEWLTHFMYPKPEWSPPSSDSHNMSPQTRVITSTEWLSNTTCVTKPEWAPSLSDSYTTYPPNPNDHHHWVTHTLHVSQTWVITTTEWLTLHVSSNLSDHHHWVTL